MIKVKVYQINGDDERELIREETINDQGLVQSVVNYEDYSPTYITTEYDEKGQIIKEVEEQDGVELSRTEVIYNEDGTAINNKHFISGELFEEHVVDIFDGGKTERSIQYGEEISRMAESKDGIQSVREFFNNGVLDEKHILTFDKASNTEGIQVLDADDKLLSNRKTVYNDEGYVTLYQERSESDQIIISEESEYKDGLLISELKKDFYSNNHYKITYGYDDHGNNVSIEVRTLSDKLLQFKKMEYDDENSLIHESGLMHGEDLTLDYEYEKLN
ncbi:hypothetical protein [Fulvivirga ligni]|uniref:hypothetical protein n=1 Tax=Fulvivirga ligni TaxID=2904246 RepID=UPI001F3077CF|nr:hypothetical protein [Fulvivirga ligni]UII22324.1 hypothetical protein LVD16_03655 [Fulvivirga ligni]